MAVGDHVTHVGSLTRGMPDEGSMGFVECLIEREKAWGPEPVPVPPRLSAKSASPNYLLLEVVWGSTYYPIGWEFFFPPTNVAEQ